MTIHVSKDAENAIHAAVQSGRFASADEMVERLVQEYAQRTRQQPAAIHSPGLGSIGAMRDAADELDEIVADAMMRREQRWATAPADSVSEADRNGQIC